MRIRWALVALVLVLASVQLTPKSAFAAVLLCFCLIPDGSEDPRRWWNR